MLSRKAISRRVRYLGLLARAEVVRCSTRLRGRSTKTKLIIFDPALLGYHGHHLEFARLIKAELGSVFDVKFYVNLEAPNRILAELPARPLCRYSIYPPAGNFDFQSFKALQETALITALRRIDLRELTPATVFVMHTLTVYQLSGLAEWFTALPPAHRPKLFLQFQHPLEFGVLHASDWAGALAIAREAAGMLTSAGKVVFATNSDLLKDQLSRQLGYAWTLMPVPIHWPNQAQGASSQSEAVFGFYGGLRVEKGSQLLAEAISSFTQHTYSATRFIVHAPRMECDEIASRRLADCNRVQLIRTNFRNKDEYFTEFCRANVILLPYDPHIYALRTSGIFIEALGLGRPVITTDGTWMAHQLRTRSATGLTMASYSAKALCDCLEAARDAVLNGSWSVDLDRDIVSSNTGSAFCAALISAFKD
jgi:glycosyl transferase family 1